MPPPSLTQWEPVGLAVPAPFLRADGAEALSSLARLIASGAVSSRTDLAKRTGLARSTIGAHLDRLQDSGLIREAGIAEPSGRGRPAQRLELAPDAGFVLVADLGVHSARLAVADLGQRLLAQETLPVQLSRGPEDILDLVEQRWRDLLSVAQCPPDRVRTIAVGLPGPVDRSTGTPVRPPLMPGWDAYPVGQKLRERFNCHVLVNNDASLMALGEARALPPSQYPLVFIKVSTGIGCGIIGASGELHDGADGAAGDIGHIRVPDSDHVVCRCGNVGCLESVASASAMIRALQDPLPDFSIPPGDFTDEELQKLVNNIRQGDAQTIRLLREAATVLGRLVASMVNVINPARIVLGGAIDVASDDLLAGVRSGVYNRAMPLATRNLTIAHSVLGPVAGVVGGAVSAIEHVLSPEGLITLTTPTSPHDSPGRQPRPTSANGGRRAQPGFRQPSVRSSSSKPRPSRVDQSEP